MIEKTIIICDIDNTILSQVPRKKRIIEDLFNVIIPERDIYEDFNLEESFHKVETFTSKKLDIIKNDFEKVFFSTNYYEKECFSVIDHSNKVLKELSEYCEIQYLTARDISLKEATIEQLKEYGFPAVEESHIMFASVTKEKLVGFEQESFKAKRELLKKLKNKKHNSIIAIGDRISDIGAAYVNGIPSVILSDLKDNDIRQKLSVMLETSEQDIDNYAFISLQRWQDIKRFILHTIGESEEINSICQMHSQNYADWLDDLDQKSALILVIATFCATLFLNFLASGQSIFVIICSGIGFFSSIISMFLAIKGFSSRVTHSAETMKALLFKKNDSMVLTPLKQREEIEKSHFSSMAGAKYIWSRYSTFNKNSIISKNMFNLRAANYDKIYPEYYGKCLLEIAILMLLLIGGIDVGNLVHLFPENKLVSSSSHPVISIEQNDIKNESILILSSIDFLIDSDEIALKGKEKIDGYIRENGADKMYVTFSEDLFSSDSEMIMDAKQQLYLAVVYNYVSMSEKDIEVIMLG